MKNNLLYFTALFFLMLVTAVFWGTWFTLTRSIGEFSSMEFMHIGQVIIDNVGTPMKILVPGTFLLVIVSLWLGRKKNGILYGVISLVLLIGVLLITLIVLVPVDNDIKSWTPDSIPSNWDGLRSKWAAWHAARTFFSLASFAFFELFIASDSRTGRDRKYKLEKKNKGLWI
ncbi:MAG TPA: anthrone oxygenase family protein [Bacteroidales bacterium]|nr:anthrone oxygenase family protein [Bacteroidales bacterium]